MPRSSRKAQKEMARQEAAMRELNAMMTSVGLPHQHGESAAGHLTAGAFDTKGKRPLHRRKSKQVEHEAPQPPELPLTVPMDSLPDA